jgi:hypothetical protein
MPMLQATRINASSRFSNNGFKVVTALSFTTELVVPPQMAFAALVETFVSDAARRNELTPEQQRGVVAAATRGFETIIEDSIVEARQPIRLVASSTPLHLTLSLFERGLPMDDALAQRNPKWNELANNVDAIHWRLHGTAGNELRLIVNRTHGILQDVPAPSIQEEDVPLAPEQEYTIRRFLPTDASGIARAFYLTYGYAYDMCAVYVPSRLIELNESGRYISIVAVAADGELVGHYALARNGDEPIAGGCGAIVLPAHRGRDLLNRLRQRAEREALAIGLAAYYSEPVTDHPRTQHASESFGAKACGITLGEIPRSFVARHMELSTTAQRQSCMLYVKPLRPRECRMIYAPAHHRSIIAKIYEQLDLPIAIGEGAESSGCGIFHTEIDRGDRIGTVAVDTIGEETAQRVCQAIEDLRASHHLGAIYASLPLEDPGTPALCRAIERCGLFFCGVGPWMLSGKDALRLQMPLTTIDLSVLVVIGDFGKVLLDYIASERERCSVAS